MWHLAAGQGSTHEHTMGSFLGLGSPRLECNQIGSEWLAATWPADACPGACEWGKHALALGLSLSAQALQLGQGQVELALTVALQVDHARVLLLVLIQLFLQGAALLPAAPDLLLLLCWAALYQGSMPNSPYSRQKTGVALVAACCLAELGSGDGWHILREAAGAAAAPTTD